MIILCECTLVYFKMFKIVYTHNDLKGQTKVIKVVFKRVKYSFIVFKTYNTRFKLLHY